MQINEEVSKKNASLKLIYIRNFTTEILSANHFFVAFCIKISKNG